MDSSSGNSSCGVRSSQVGLWLGTQLRNCRCSCLISLIEAKEFAGSRTIMNKDTAAKVAHLTLLRP